MLTNAYYLTTPCCLSGLPQILPTLPPVPPHPFEVLFLQPTTVHRPHPPLYTLDTNQYPSNNTSSVRPDTDPSDLTASDSLGSFEASFLQPTMVCWPHSLLYMLHTNSYLLHDASSVRPDAGSDPTNLTSESSESIWESLPATIHGTSASFPLAYAACQLISIGSLRPDADCADLRVRVVSAPVRNSALVTTHDTLTSFPLAYVRH